MRRSSSTTSRCGASSGRAAASRGPALMARSLLAVRPTRTIGARNEPEHGVAIFGVDHGRKQPAGGVLGVGPELGKRPSYAFGLQACKLHRQRLTLRCHVKQPLAPVIGASPLLHIRFVDQLLENPSKRLLGDLEDIKKLCNLHPRVAIDKMQYPVMCPAEAKRRQHLIRVADKVAISKEQQLDDIPNRLDFTPRPLRRRITVASEGNIYVS